MRFVALLGGCLTLPVTIYDVSILFIHPCLFDCCPSYDEFPIKFQQNDLLKVVGSPCSPSVAQVSLTNSPTPFPSCIQSSEMCNWLFVLMSWCCPMNVWTNYH